MKYGIVIWLVLGACTADGAGTRTYRTADKDGRENTKTDTETGPSDDTIHRSSLDDAVNLDTETDAESSQERETDKNNIDNTALGCPSGSTRHTSSTGQIVCCSASKPIFCDENADGYTGGCWSDGVNCDTLTFCKGRWTACREDSLPFCAEDNAFICYPPCGVDATTHETASGRRFCCTDAMPTFCDEDHDGYPGGCWSDGVDCQTITLCGNSYTGCNHGALVFCGEDNVSACYPCPEDSKKYETTGGRPVCCTAEKPLFCDENENGYSGGVLDRGDRLHQCDFLQRLLGRLSAGNGICLSGRIVFL